MDADLKQRWVEALRSGRYPQGTGYLRRMALDGAPETWCCLGVLCELGDPSQWFTHSDQDRAWSYREGDSGEYRMGTLPEMFRVSAGLSIESMMWLAVLNDQSSGFDEIAD